MFMHLILVEFVTSKIASSCEPEISTVINQSCKCVEVWRCEHGLEAGEDWQLGGVSMD